jgi:hypothetical protein
MLQDETITQSHNFQHRSVYFRGAGQQAEISTVGRYTSARRVISGYY